MNILDASAILALLYSEKGSDVVQAHTPGALVSSVNYCEVMSKLADRFLDTDSAYGYLHSLELDIISFSPEHAQIAANLRVKTKHLGLSLADRACFALAIKSGLPVVTADRIWSEVSLGVKVVLIR